ncbi:MAG: DUF4388 domain-containing protein [Planctomycetota bacterium]
MSFQGDVRGIGLAELLQGLARGRKEGVLTLTSKGEKRAVLGLEDGKAWLLPDPDEEVEDWKTRGRDAWADDPSFTIEPSRMEPIVKAGRLEQLYSLLDGGGVHFRFDPGQMPERVTRLEEQGHSTSEIHCDPIPVEFLLLEYARIADELELAGHPDLVNESSTPCIQDMDELGSIPPHFVQHCDANSTIEEIADRLGWPLRQAQLTILSGLQSGGFRLAHPIEIIRLALHELQRKQFSRAATRLSVWIRQATPGPLVPEDAQALSNEWLAGRLTSALRLMDMRDVRSLLRRLDAALGSTSHAVVHWTEANRIRSNDRISRLRLAAMRLRDGGEECGLDTREVLDLARELRDHGSPVRSGPALAIAAYLQPTVVPQRLELGMGLLAARRVEDCAPWILSACTDLLAQGHADRVLNPLRALLDEDPRNREARELLTRARRQSTKTKKLRRNAAIVASCVAVLGSAAVVKVKIDEQRRSRIEGIRSLLDQPASGIAQLEVHFKDDVSLEIADLRRELEDRLRTSEMATRSAWLDEYHAAQVEAQEGDLVKAVELIRALPAPPRLRLVTEAWPSTTDVMMSMTGRLRQEVLALGPPSIHAPQQAIVEESVRTRAEALRDALNDYEKADTKLAEFRRELDDVIDLVIERDRQRSVDLLAVERRELLAENDRLLRLAHDALERFEYERALRHYEEILENDPAGKVRRVLEEEVEDTRKKLRAVKRARAAAQDGRHQKALEILDETFEETVRIMLPWKVTTTPPGVKVTIEREDQPGEIERETPFTIEGTFADTWTLNFQLPDFDRRLIVVRGPQDVTLALSRTPALHFEATGRVDAIPAPLQDGTTGEYIVCDRNGTIARLAWNGEMRWRQDIKTVSGVARRPVPVPGRDSQYLFMTETGVTWLINPDDGYLDGPWDLEEPPVFGPVVVGDEVRAQLRDGRMARWRTSLRPEVVKPNRATALDESLRHGFQGVFTTLRPGNRTIDELRTPTADGSGWTVRVDDGWYTVSEDGEEDAPFQITRQGTWAYVAWESPAVPGDPPVLWISDGMGLRAFLPPGAKRTLQGSGTGFEETGPPVPNGLFPPPPPDSGGGR